MQPKVYKATEVVSFSIKDYEAVLLNEIEADSIIQYHYILGIYSNNQNPVMFICSEWSSWIPEDKSRPCFGVFVDDGHENHGFDERWCDQNLFLLDAVGFFKNQFGLKLDSLTEGEAFALAKVMAETNAHSSGQINISEERQKLLWKTIGFYDEPLAKYLGKYQPSE